MLDSFVIMAAGLVDPFNEAPLLDRPQSSSGGLPEFLIIIGVALILALILFLVVYLKKKGRRNRTLERAPRSIYRDAEEGKSSRDSSSGRTKVRKKRRRTHPDNLPRNPTLGETGGLPPLRPEDPAEPVQ